MQPSNTMLARLRALARNNLVWEPSADLEEINAADDGSWRAGYEAGHNDGRIEMAREILEDLARGE